MLSIAQEVSCDIEEIYASESADTTTINFTKKLSDDKKEYLFESNTIKLKMFGKIHNIVISYGMDIGFASPKDITKITNHIKKFVRNCEKITDPLTDQLIATWNVYQVEYPYVAKAKSVSDLQGFYFHHLSIDEYNYRKGNGIQIILDGEWDVEPEHGIGIKFDSNFKCITMATVDLCYFGN